MWRCKNCGGTKFVATVIAEQEGEFDDIKEIADWEED